MNHSEAGRSLLVKRLALSVFAVVVALLLVEGAVRVRQWIRYGSASAALVQLKLDPRTGLMIPITTSRIRLDGRGFRNPEIQMPKPAGRIRLAFLGASTTFCAEVSNNEATWPHLVAQALAERYPGATFDYVNAGVPGYVLPTSLKNLELRVAPLAPDFILYYEATNDLSKDTRELAAREGIYSGLPDSPSPLARVSATWFLLEKNLLLRERMRPGRPGRKLSFDPDSLARGFEERLVKFIRASQGLAPVVAVATFSHKVRRDQTPEAQLHACNTSLYYAPYMTVQGFLDAWDGYNRAIRAAARETGALLIEGEGTIPGDDAHFQDSVHFLDPGSRAMAERVVRALVASPEFNRLVESRGAAQRSRHAGPRE